MKAPHSSHHQISIGNLWKFPKKRSQSNVSQVHSVVGFHPLCSSAKHPASTKLTVLHIFQVPKATFSWGCVAFLTAFFLNFLALPFQHRATEIQVCALACSVQLLAAFHSLLNFHELAPVLTGPNGKAVPVLRYISSRQACL